MHPSARPAAIDHVNLVVRDIDRTIGFYESLFQLRVGFDTILEGAWIDEVTGLTSVRARCVFLESANQAIRIELLQYIRPDAVTQDGLERPNLIGVRHLAFRVDDLDSFCSRAAEYGAGMLSAPVRVPFVLPGGFQKRLCYLTDPDGTLLEAAEYRPADSF